jgi:hypothetical protein
LSEADGSLFFSTGNTDGARGLARRRGRVPRRHPIWRIAIDPHDFFAPSNWKELDDDDLDLGGVTPLPITLPGSPIPLLLALGKDGKAYLLDRTSCWVASAARSRCALRRAA